MVSQLAVIATATGGTPEILTDDVGILVPPGDASALAAAMAELTADAMRRRRLSIAAFDLVSNRFSVCAVAADTLRYLRAVAA
jgi:glycosyltransferase involved in cell wall biosynthesis